MFPSNMRCYSQFVVLQYNIVFRCRHLFRRLDSHSSSLLNGPISASLRACTCRLRTVTLPPLRAPSKKFLLCFAFLWQSATMQRKCPASSPSLAVLPSPCRYFQQTIRSKLGPQEWLRAQQPRKYRHGPHEKITQQLLVPTTSHIILSDLHQLGHVDESHCPSPEQHRLSESRNHPVPRCPSPSSVAESPRPSPHSQSHHRAHSFARTTRRQRHGHGTRNTISRLVDNTLPTSDQPFPKSVEDCLNVKNQGLHVESERSDGLPAVVG